MDHISNAKKLGVIVLAAKYLANLNLLAPRVISAAAEALDVSRKTGYKTAQRIEEELRDRPGKEPGEEELAEQGMVPIGRLQAGLLDTRSEQVVALERSQYRMTISTDEPVA